MKLIRGKDNGDGGTHKPSGQWMTVSIPRSSILPDGHADSDEATDTFRRVKELLTQLKMSQPCVREQTSGRAGGWNVGVLLID